MSQSESNPLPFHPQADIIDQILKEVKRAKQKFPNWPDHIVARSAIVAEEAGELVKACLQYKYERGVGIHAHWQLDEIYKEAVQTAAMAIRFLEEFHSLINKTHNDNRTKPSEDLVSQNSERES